MPDGANNQESTIADQLPEFIAHYRILRRLGKGGMGEVFLAEDTKQHGRKVALKVLPEELTRSETRLRRFRQEARAVLALNHPNILTVYEIGETENTHYIATEYIEGETLRGCLWREPLRIDEALGVAIQVAMALETAHAAGIVHRDIKPENIMLRQDKFVRDRFVKVLDFGLAKLTDREPTSFDPDAVTIPITETSPGTIMGTSGYMSPEQAQGENIDERSDIFSLGVVLYEMVAGQPPFKGRTDSHTRVSILDHEPAPLLEHATDVPRQLERIVSKALAKDRSKRYQTVTDLKLDLEQLRDELRSSPAMTVTSEGRRPSKAETITVSSVPTHKREPIETLAEGTVHDSRAKQRTWRLVLLTGLALVSVLLIAGV